MAKLNYFIQQSILLGAAVRVHLVYLRMHDPVIYFCIFCRLHGLKLQP